MYGCFEAISNLRAKSFLPILRYDERISQAHAGPSLQHEIRLKHKPFRREGNQAGASRLEVSDVSTVSIYRVHVFK